MEVDASDEQIGDWIWKSSDFAKAIAASAKEETPASAAASTGCERLAHETRTLNHANDACRALTPKESAIPPGGDGGVAPPTHTCTEHSCEGYTRRGNTVGVPMQHGTQQKEYLAAVVGVPTLIKKGSIGDSQEIHRPVLMVPWFPLRQVRPVPHTKNTTKRNPMVPPVKNLPSIMNAKEHRPVLPPIANLPTIKKTRQPHSQLRRGRNDLSPHPNPLLQRPDTERGEKYLCRSRSANQKIERAPKQRKIMKTPPPFESVLAAYPSSAVADSVRQAPAPVAANPARQAPAPVVYEPARQAPSPVAADPARQAPGPVAAVRNNSRLWAYGRRCNHDACTKYKQTGCRGYCITHANLYYADAEKGAGREGGEKGVNKLKDTLSLAPVVHRPPVMPPITHPAKSQHPAKEITPLKASTVDVVLADLVSAATTDPTLWRSQTFALAVTATIEHVAAKSPAIITKAAQASPALAAPAVARAAVMITPKARLPKQSRKSLRLDEAGFVITPAGPNGGGETERESPGAGHRAAILGGQFTAHFEAELSWEESVHHSELPLDDRHSERKDSLPPTRPPPTSVVTPWAAVGASPLEPPKSAAEVEFDIANPPSTPIEPPGTEPVMDSDALATKNDVLCSGMYHLQGNRRFRALVRDFQSTYLLAQRFKKSPLARALVLIVRHRGGRFLRRNVADGGWYELGDKKAEAKTLRALRKGLDARGMKREVITPNDMTVGNTEPGRGQLRRGRNGPNPNPHLQRLNTEKGKKCLRRSRSTNGKPERALKQRKMMKTPPPFEPVLSAHLSTVAADPATQVPAPVAADPAGQAPAPVAADARC